MKKALSLVLAALMVAGTASVAFAASLADFTVETEDDAKAWFENDNTYYTWKSGDSWLKAGGNLKQGTTVYFKLNHKSDYEDKDMKKLKAKGDWTNGADLVKELKVEYKRDNNGDYGYWVALYTNAESTVEFEDLTGEIKLYRTSPNNEMSTLKLNFSELSHKSIKFVEDKASCDQEDYSDVSDDYIVYDSEDDRYKPVVGFEEDLGDITIEFDEIGQYDINVDDQEKLYLGYNFTENAELAAKYSYAELEFINFLNAPKFNRNGVFYLYADEGSFLYALNDGKLEAVKTTYDTDYEALKFTVKQFPDSWVISDTELEIVNDSTDTEGETTPSDTVKPNPGTGR